MKTITWKEDEDTKCKHITYADVHVHVYMYTILTQQVKRAHLHVKLSNSLNDGNTTYQLTSMPSHY